MPAHANKKYDNCEHNVACSTIFKAISKTGFLGSCFVCMDVGSSKRFSDKSRFTSSRPDAVLVSPISTNTKKQQTSKKRGWVIRSAKGQLMRGTRSISAAPPATRRSTFPRQHRPKDLSILQRDIHPIEIKYCEDTRPQNQLSAAQEQHKGLHPLLNPLRSFCYSPHHPFGSGWHHLQQPHAGAFKELGLDSKKG